MAFKSQIIGFFFFGNDYTFGLREEFIFFWLERVNKDGCTNR